jgi:hypothetical protein
MPAFSIRARGSPALVGPRSEDQDWLSSEDVVSVSGIIVSGIIVWGVSVSGIIVSGVSVSGIIVSGIIVSGVSVSGIIVVGWSSPLVVPIAVIVLSLPPKGRTIQGVTCLSGGA